MEPISNILLLVNHCLELPAVAYISFKDKTSPVTHSHTYGRSYYNEDT